MKTRHRGHDVKYSSKQELKRAIKQRQTSQSRALLEYYSSVVGRDGIFTRPGAERAIPAAKAE
jgi:predicted Ser/Thr protein kinase